MSLHTPIMTQPASADPAINITGQEFRQYIAAMHSAHSGGGTLASNIQGVTTADLVSGAQTGDMAVTQRGAGANFSVDVAAGYAYVVGDDVTLQGTYFCWNDATVNVSTFSTGAAIGAPASGTRNHRLVLQVQDKLNNGAWTGYTAQFQLLQDTGSGTPAEPGSAITLAVVAISAGQVSILNANITDYRTLVGDAVADKPADTTRSNTATMTDDPDLQLLNLYPSAHYEVYGDVLYSAVNGADFQWTWRESAGTAMKGAAWHQDLSGNT